MMIQLLRSAVIIAAMGPFIAAAMASESREDLGVRVEGLLQEGSLALFGFARAVHGSAPKTSRPFRTVTQSAEDQVLLAEGLRVGYLTREAAEKTDMMAFFPAGNSTHLITCVEGDRESIGIQPDGSPKFNPSIQRIHLDTGRVETILRGMSGCDGIRATPWGTILATEERGDGGAYEILDPLRVTEQSVLDRATGTVTDTNRIVRRTALPTVAWEGIAILPSGVVIAGDELRPGAAAPGAAGGTIYKFVPTAPYTTAAPIPDLKQSPLAAGRVYALQVSCQDALAQYGQGCEVGNATWVEINAAVARADATAKGATGYYRPEDLHQDPLYHEEARPGAVRFCWTNTGNEKSAHYGEVVCGVDADPLHADPAVRSVTVTRFLEGDPDFNSFDNLDFQPETGNLYVLEDHENGDIFACLPDGKDRDIKTDGCVRMLSVKDSSAEPTGFIFSADGMTAYLSIQHSDDANMPKVGGYATDDVIKITGFKIPTIY